MSDDRYEYRIYLTTNGEYLAQYTSTKYSVWMNVSGSPRFTCMAAELEAKAHAKKHMKEIERVKNAGVVKELGLLP